MLLLDVANRSWSDEVLQRARASTRPGCRPALESPELSGARPRPERPSPPAPATRPPARSESASTARDRCRWRSGPRGVVFAALDEFAADQQARVHAFCHAVPGSMARDGRDAVGRRLAHLAPQRHQRRRRRFDTLLNEADRMAAGRRGPDLPPLPRRRADPLRRPGRARRVRRAQPPPRPRRADPRRARGRGVRPQRLARPHRRARWRTENQGASPVAAPAARCGRRSSRRCSSCRSSRWRSTRARRSARRSSAAWRRTCGRTFTPRCRQPSSRASLIEPVPEWIEPYREQRERFRALYPALKALR